MRSKRPSTGRPRTSARVTHITPEEAADAAADDLPTLMVMLSYAQSTCLTTVQRWTGIYAYEAIIAVCAWCIAVREAIAGHLPNQEDAA